MKKLLTVLGFAFIVGTIGASTFSVEKQNFLLKTFVPWEEKNRDRLWEVSPQIKIQSEYVKHNAPRWVEITKNIEKSGDNQHDLKVSGDILNKMYRDSMELYWKNYKKTDK